MSSSQVQRPPPKSVSPDIPVVAIGASAGGLEALTAILRALPTDIALAFILMATTLGLTGLANVMIPRRYRGG